MHDGAPSTTFQSKCPQLFASQYPNRWIGRGNDAPVKWPPRSPDMTPLDYFLWGSLKTIVYSRPINNEEEMWERIQNAVNILKNDAELMQRVNLNFLRRINLCTYVNGGHFEQWHWGHGSSRWSRCRSASVF